MTGVPEGEHDFVGQDRQEVVDDLLAEWGAVASDRRARLVLIEAEPGWGKTRIVQEFYARLAARQTGVPYWPARIVDAGAAETSRDIRDRRKAVRPPDFRPDDGATPGFLWLGHDIDAGHGARADMTLADLADQIAGILERERRIKGARKDAVRLAFQIVSTLSMLPDPVAIASNTHGIVDGVLRLGRAAGGVVPVGLETQQQTQLASFSQLLREIWGRTGKGGPPAVIALEDAHEARSLTLDFCRMVLAEKAFPFLIVACAQPGRPGSGIRELADDLPLRSRIIELAPMAMTDLASLAGTGASRYLADALADKADGNPYHLQLLLLLCRQRFGPALEGLDREAVLALPPQIADTLEALWSGLSAPERRALAAFALLGPRTAVEASAHGDLIEHLEIDTAISSGWMREQPDLLRFLEVARWQIAHTRVGEALDAETQRDLVTLALDVVMGVRREGGQASPLLDEMLTHLAQEALRLGCDIDCVAVGQDVLAWATSLRWATNYVDAARAADVAEGLAEKAIHRHATRDAGDDLLVDVLVLRCALARAIHGRASRPAIRAAGILEEQGRAVGARRPVLLVLSLVEVQRSLRERGAVEQFTHARDVMQEALGLHARLEVKDAELDILVRRATYPWLSIDGRRREAAAAALACAEECAARYGDDDRRTLESLADAAWYTMRFDTRASIGMRRQLLESRRRIWGQSGHPVVATTCNTLASSLVAAGGLDNLYEAITLSDEALQIQEAYFGREGVRALNCLGVSSHARVELAEVLERQGRLAEAETMRLEALQLAEENARVRARRFPNRDNWVSRHRYGVALEMTGDDAGVALLREVLAERLAATDEERRAPTTEASWNADDLARALRRRGHDDEAAEALARVADRRSRFPDLDSAE